jgi:hypothetical protein
MRKASDFSLNSHCLLAAANSGLEPRPPFVLTPGLDLELKPMSCHCTLKAGTDRGSREIVALHLAV